MQKAFLKIDEGSFEITLASIDQLIVEVHIAWKQERTLRLVTFNPEMLLEAIRNPNFAESIRSAQILLPDGIGLVFLLRKLTKYPKIERIAGIELAWKMLQTAAESGKKIALLGSSQESLKGTIAKIKRELPDMDIVYGHHGYFTEAEQEDILNDLRSSKPDLILVAMPFTHQEPLIAILQSRLERGVMLGIGGSFDVWSGRVKRAPALLRSLNLEWLWRLISQPHRTKRILGMLWEFVPLFWKLSTKEKNFT
ncbi:MAG: WecB/TagA/CpsF family glycosyltransferase [Candidatus Caenarcaniphilales bacterium]|nr:WecB/TagA/CpsF family glycosyltransferase [Candidatus Caenarcaniphilales bacterium]